METGRVGREDVDAIIESYGHFSKVEDEAIGGVDSKKKQTPEGHRKLEKEVAQRCFKTHRDWNDPKKISYFLRETVWKTK